MMGEAMSDLFISLDHDQFKSILSMRKGPQAEALYLIEQYQYEAPQLAEDCRDILIEMEDHETAEYWREVCACIKRLTIKH